MNHIMNELMRTMVGGAIILIIPALLICTGLAVMAYRRREGGSRQ